mgnify:FL=1
MRKEELIQYFEDAIALETEIVTQENLVSQFEAMSEKKKPILVERKVQVEKPDTERLDDEMNVALIFIAFTTVSALFIQFLVFGMAADTDFIPLISMVIIDGIILAIYLPKKRELEKEYSEQMDKYNEDYNLCQEENENRREEFAYNQKCWKDSCTKMRATLEKPLKETKENLERVYSKNIIYPKYRNLPALTSIYEYYVTGRCEELSGPYGAYNLYEDEVRKDKIISQLNTVIANLEQIKQNQYKLYEQVCQIQSNTNRMVRELNAIKGYVIELTNLTALNTYYNGVTALNTRIMTSYM